MQTVKAMYEQACDVRRGNLPHTTLSLTCHAPLEQTVALDKVQRGSVGHLTLDTATNAPAIQLGLPADGNAVPLFVVPGGYEVDTAGGAYEYNMQLYSHPDNPYQKGTFALLSTGAFELASTAYDRDSSYEPNTPLTASAHPDKLGLLAPGEYYKDIICGVVSMGLQVNPMVFNKNPVTNPQSPKVLLYWTHYQPRLDKATAEDILA
jgi:hypothetical protein